MQKRALIAMQYSALHHRTWKTPTVQKPCNHGLFCFVSHEYTAAERVRLISRRFKTEKMEFHIDKTSRQVYNRTQKQQGITAKSVRMPLWIETG